MSSNYRLTKNFTYDELTYSATAERLKLDNTPNAKETAELIKLATLILQPIRDKWGRPIIVTSGFRSEAVNKAVGGVKNSQHRLGQAADLKPNTVGSTGELYRMIKDMTDRGEITVGQCIWEYGDNKNPKWVHVSLPTKTHKNEFFRIK